MSVAYLLTTWHCYCLY